MKKSEFFLKDVLSNTTEGRKLIPNYNSTVQPVALMRLGLFVPTLKRKGKKVESVMIDASEELAKLEIAQAEGYTDIKINGPRLTIETDFKVWIAIILCFAKYGLKTNTIELTFSQFASMAGFSDKEKNFVLRKRIAGSLTRLRGTTISLSSKNAGKHLVTGLLQMGKFDTDADKIKLIGDEQLWELYRLDHQVLLQLAVLKRLSNKGSAQALYTFIESLPERPLPLSFSRIKRRLNLTTPDSQQNRTIKKSIDDLISAGYLDASLAKKGKEWHLFIYNRNSRCNLANASYILDQFP